LRACCWCIHYSPVSWLERTVERNISGNNVWYRKYGKHRCALRQEDKYLKDCDFEEDKEKLRRIEDNIQKF